MFKTKDLFKTLFLTYIFAYIATPLGYFIRVLYAKNLSVEEVGLIYSIVGIFVILVIFTNLGIFESILYYGTRYFEKKKYKNLNGIFLLMLSVVLVLTLLFSGVLYLFSDYLALNYFKNEMASQVLNILLIYFIFLNLSSALKQYLIAIHKYHHHSLYEFMRSFFILGISFFFFYIGDFSITNIAIAWSLAMFIIFVYYMFETYRKSPWLINNKPQLKKEEIKGITSFSLYSLLGNTAIPLLSRIDIVLITFFLGLTEVGYYTIALSIATLLPMAVSPFITAVMPLTTKYISQNNMKAVNSMYSFIYEKSIFFILPIFTLILVYPKEIITILYTPEYLPALTALSILLFSYLLNVFSSVNLQVLSGLGKVKARMYLLYFSAILNIAGNIILIPMYGIVGAAFSTAFSISVIFLGSFYYVSSACKIRLRMKFILKIILLNILLLLMVELLKNMLNLNIYIETIIVVSIAGLTYGLLGLAFKLIDLRELFNLMFKKEKK